MAILTANGPGNAHRPDRDLERSFDGEYRLPAAGHRPSGTKGAWLVGVNLSDHVIIRSVTYKGNHWSTLKGDKSDEVIWPTWPTTVQEEIATASSPLTELQQHWDASISRLRDSAKWMATVLGAALASVIPTVPLANLNQRHIPGLHVIFGLTGMACLAVTLLLVLLVMRPHSVSYDDIYKAKPPVGRLRRKLYDLAKRRREQEPDDRPRNWRKSFAHALESPLYRWKDTIQSNPDLYLPCGINSLRILRQAIVAEEMTLVALSRARENVDGNDPREKLSAAQSARAARLHELRTSAASIVIIGTFYSVRARSSWATFGGVLFGLAGIILIVLALA